MNGGQVASGAGPGSVLDGRYELLTPIGKGGMGLVYAARHVELGRRLAVKLLHPEYARDSTWRERFRREARATTAIGHENIVDVIDIRVDDAHAPYYVMELLEGESLGELLRREGPLPWSRVRSMAGQLCDALAAAHRAGVVHRDLKPANCFRVVRRHDRDFIKILDFGIAKLLRSSHEDPTITSRGEVMGTPGFMAPEQLCGGEVDGRTDVYALGALLYRMLAGRMPFEGKTPEDILARQFEHAPPEVRQVVADSDVPAHVERALRAALEPRSAARPSSMRAFAALLGVAGAEHEDAAQRGCGTRAIAVASPVRAVERPTIREGRARGPGRIVWAAGLGAALVGVALVPGVCGEAPSRAPAVAAAARMEPAAAVSACPGESCDSPASPPVTPVEASLQVEVASRSVPSPVASRPTPAAPPASVSSPVASPVASRPTPAAPPANAQASAPAGAAPLDREPEEAASSMPAARRDRGPPPTPAAQTFAQWLDVLWPALTRCLCRDMMGIPPSTLEVEATPVGAGWTFAPGGTNRDSKAVRRCVDEAVRVTPRPTFRAPARGSARGVHCVQ